MSQKLMTSKNLKRKNKFYLLLSLLVISRCLDFFTTFLYTPDLSKETNILVQLFNFDYFLLSIVQITLVALVGYFLYIYCFRTVDTPNVSANTSLKDFIGIFFFKDKERTKEIFLKFPTNKNSFSYSLGYILTYSLITIGFMVGTSTSLLLISEKYREFYRHGVIITIFVLVFMIVCFF